MICLCALELCLTTIITNHHHSLLPLVLNSFFIIEEMLSRGFHHLDVSCKSFERWVFCLHVHNIMLMVCVFGLYFRYVNLWFVFDLNVSSKISNLSKYPPLKLGISLHHSTKLHELNSNIFKDATLDLGISPHYLMSCMRMFRDLVNLHAMFVVTSFIGRTSIIA
jgi:hypothetical protein